MSTPQDQPDELEPEFNPATTSAADDQSPVDDYTDIEMDIHIPDVQFNPITTEAAEPPEEHKD